MNKAAKFGALGAGAGTLFLGAMVGFGQMLGAEMSSMPVVGGLFAEPIEEESEDPDGSEGEEGAEAGNDSGSNSRPDPSLPATPQYRSASTLLDRFVSPSPFELEELEALEAELREQIDVLGARERALDERERVARDSEERIVEERAELDRYRFTLEELASELRLREAELDRDEAARAAEMQDRDKKLGELLLNTDEDNALVILKSKGPDASARILATMAEEDAATLLELLTGDEWLLYSDAYTALITGPNAPTKR